MTVDIANTITAEELDDLSERYAKLYTHPIAKLISEFRRLRAENARLKLPIVGLQGVEAQREEARAKALQWEMEWLSEHGKLETAVADAAKLRGLLERADTFTDHTPACTAKWVSHGCTCGVEKLREEILLDSQVNRVT